MGGGGVWGGAHPLHLPPRSAAEKLKLLYDFIENHERCERSVPSNHHHRHHDVTLSLSKIISRRQDQCPFRGRQSKLTSFPHVKLAFSHMGTQTEFTPWPNRTVRHTQSHRLQTRFSSISLNTVWHEIFAGSDFCEFFQWSAKIFPQKFTPEYKIFSNRKFAAALRHRVCSIANCLFPSETKRYTMKYWFYVV